MIQVHSFQEYQEAYKRSKTHPQEFWAEVANSFYWSKPWLEVSQWNFIQPNIQWFLGAETNITINCLDRHLDERGHQTAIIWEPNNPSDEAIKITYFELHERVCKVANVLKSLGVSQGDRVCIYMPMIPEAMIAMLACARLGAIHSVVFAGFSAQSIQDRILDAKATFMITADASYRGAKTIPLKPIVDEALANCPGIKKCLVFNYLSTSFAWNPKRDVDWKVAEALADLHCDAASVSSEHPLFILYTSGSTGKPKGVVHTTGGYMVYSEFSFRNVFQYRNEEVFWCTADVGWITGHTYLTYAPLLAGGTTLVFEGIPTWPEPDRFWQVVERHHVNIIYTAPTAIRSLMSYGSEYPEKYAMDSLRVIGSVGEPINEEAWYWYHTHVGKSRCLFTDTWWQTETGGALLATLVGITPAQPTYAGYPLPGVFLELVDSEGKTIEGDNAEGNLVITAPMPSMIRTTWGDHERCRTAYFATYPNLYFTGDGARRDHEGMYRILGRVDDVINVSGHRLGTAEVENAINEHPAVIESAVVGYPHDIKGQGIYAYVICDPAFETSANLSAEIAAIVSKIIGPIARPDKIQVVPGLPKTRSGKIMRRILRKIAENELGSLGDTSTLLDPSVVDAIVAGRN